MYYLYIIANNLNGKEYVGVTKNPKMRWYRHLWNVRHPEGLGHCLIHRAMAKHGHENFTLSVLKKGMSEIEAFEAERLEIKTRGTHGNGYNETDGGDSGPIMRGAENPMFGKRRPDLVYRNKATRGKKISPEHRALLISYSRKPKSLETRLKIGASIRSTCKIRNEKRKFSDGTNFLETGRAVLTT